MSRIVYLRELDINDDGDLLELMKRKHHHADGSPVELKLREQSEFERLVQQNSAPQEVFSAAQEQQKPEQPAQEEQHNHQDGTVAADCGCGQTVVAQLGKGDGKVEIAEYNVTGKKEGEMSGYDISGGSSGYETSEKSGTAEYNVSGGSSGGYHG